MKSYSEWKNKDLTLFKKRKEGAEKISREALAKGGPSELTHWHFAAKLPQYDEVFKILAGPNPEQKVKAKFDELVGRLNSTLDDQKKFQRLMGEIEVYGEVLVQLRIPRIYG